MTTWFRAAAMIAVLAPATACSFYFGDDTGDDCGAYGAFEGADRDPGPGYRNPETGTCEFYGGGCYEPQPGYVDTGAAEPAALPDWAACAGPCEGLDELTCLAATECRAAYLGEWVYDCYPGSDCLPPANQFLGCWGIAPSGPAEPEDCWGLDAYSCSRHNDCSAVYTEGGAPPPDGGGSGLSAGYTFVSCQPEIVQGCYADEECPDGYECTADTECLPPPCGPDGNCESPVPVCYGQCVPSQNTCTAVDCGPGYHCEEYCYPGGGAGDDDGDGVSAPYCEPTCVPDYNTCDAIDCGPGYRCEELCYPCDPLPDGTGCEDAPYCEPTCVPIDPQTCDAVECGPGSHCELQCYPDPGDPTDPPTMDQCYPVCVSDTPNGCAATDCAPGYHCEETCSVEPCTPEGVCPPPECYGSCVLDTPTEACEALATEDACVGRPDCIAVYTGEDCECYPWGCICQTLTYERCEAGWIIIDDGGMPARSRVLASRARP